MFPQANASPYFPWNNPQENIVSNLKSVKEVTDVTFKDPQRQVKNLRKIVKKHWQIMNSKIQN